MKTIRCGVIGCGVIAPSHIESFKFLEDVEIKWACDLVPEKAGKMAEQYGIPHITTNYLEVLNDPEVDCIAVCTDHGSHAQIVADAMDHKKHVICEKSLGRSHECLEKMLAAHKRNPELAFGGIFQHRHEPVNRVLKELIDSGAFGTITTVSMNVNSQRTNEYYLADAWRGTWAQEGGSILINQAIHYIDLINWLLGGIAAWLIVSGSVLLLNHHLGDLASVYASEFSLLSLTISDSVTLLGFSAYLGWLGAWFSVSQHLWQIEPR